MLALSIIVAISLSRYEPFATILRQTEQHDLGKLTFAFVMLNIYLAFGQFLIIWSGNLPEEINWYLDRIRGHWGIIITLDFIFHWVIPFSLLLSRDIKRNKKRLVRVCQWMIFAKAFDLFWLIEPNFKDAARNLHFSWGILEYIAVPAALVSFWIAYFCHPAQDPSPRPNQRPPPHRNPGARTCTRLPSLQQKRTVWGWVCRSAAQLLKVMAGGSGPRPILRTVLCFPSRCQ